MTASCQQIDFASVLASTVHDMKNSLCMLIQSIEIIEHEATHLSESAKDELARLNYEANRLNSNLLQLLSLYRLERNKLPVQIEQHYIADLVEELILKNQFFAKQRAIKIHIEHDADLYWYFDYDLLNNLLNDALANALRYGNKEIHLIFSKNKNVLQIEIQDDGPGFPDFMLNSDNIEMNTPDLTSNHTGLGIFFAKLIAKAHVNKGRTGTVELRNHQDKQGGVFCITLP